MNSIDDSDFLHCFIFLPRFMAPSPGNPRVLSKVVDLNGRPDTATQANKVRCEFPVMKHRISSQKRSINVVTNENLNLTGGGRILTWWVRPSILKPEMTHISSIFILSQRNNESLVCFCR